MWVRVVADIRLVLYTSYMLQQVVRAYVYLPRVQHVTYHYVPEYK